MTHSTVQVTESPLDHVTPPDPATRTVGPVIGIDPGTLNCRVGVLRNGRLTLVSDGGRPGVIPSYVAVDTRGTLIVGQAAQRQLASYPALTVWGLKDLLLPVTSEEVTLLRYQLRCPLYETPEGHTGVVLGDRYLQPQELFAMLLVVARQRAQEYLGQPVYRTVVAIPNDWDDARKQALRAAVPLAGLHLVRLVPEPIAAAAMALRLEPPDSSDRVLLVYDWGGSAFQASVVRVTGTGYRVLSSARDTSVGGGVLSARVLEHLLSLVPEKDELLTEQHRTAALRVADAVENLKIQLSDRTEARLRVPLVLPSPDQQPRDFDLVLTRAELESLAAPLVDRTLQVCGQVVKASGVPAFSIDEVVLTGAQSRMPLVHQRLSKALPKALIRRDAPEQVVALGAVLAAGRQ